MLEVLLSALASLGVSEVQNTLSSAGESVVKKMKESHSWKRLIVDTGEFYIKNEQDKKSFYEDLKLALSKDNLSQIAKNLKSEDGYDLKYELYNSFMTLMKKYDIPYEIAEFYTMKIIYEILEQLKIVQPEKYEQYFLSDWRDEQEKSFLELQTRINKISTELDIYNREHIAIESSGQMDINLRRCTQNPSIGIEFFIVDDERFQEKFEEQRCNELIYIRGRSREETIYCVLNELWRLNDNRPIYVVEDIKSWNKLYLLGNTGNIYIPWFYADEIVAIENNTNIFALDDNTPAFTSNVIELRPRTYKTLSKCLENAGMEYDEIYNFLAETHGLYTQMKKKMFKGEYLKKPEWVTGVSERAKKTCLLIGSWEEIEGDKLIIQELYGDVYQNFLDEILPYSKGEDPLLYKLNRNGSMSYCLASTENVWSYLDISTNEPIWEKFINAVFDVINESEALFTYDTHQRTLALFKGEKLFWSKTIRKGMLKTLLIKGAYFQDSSSQMILNQLVKKILSCIHNEKQWIYISKFWRELCEISPDSVLERLEKEWEQDTGLLGLFKNQSNDIFFGKNAYIDILWGVEQFLTQKDYFWPAYRWLLKLDTFGFEYKSNSINDIFSKVFCTWMDFSTLHASEEKLKAAELSFMIDRQNAWGHLYSAVAQNGRSIVGDLSVPKYRRYEKPQSTTVAEMRETHEGYCKLLIKHMDFLVDRWNKMIELSADFSKELRKETFEQLRYDLKQMTDEEIMLIKNEIRYLIYKHRYFVLSDWAISEDKLIEYEQLLEEIKIKTLEYEYSYLFLNNHDYPLLHPVSYDKEEQKNNNEKLTEELIQKKLLEFQKKGYDLSILARACSQELYSTLGEYLSKFWNNGKWDIEVFKSLLSAQKSGYMAINYLENIKENNNLDYKKILKELTEGRCSIHILSQVYRVEARVTRDVPLIMYASEEIKREFWKNRVFCDERNNKWVLQEGKKYASIDVYLDQMYIIHYSNPLSAEEIFKCFDDIESMPHSEGNQMTSYHVKQFLKIIQEAYIRDVQKCLRISRLEIIFMNLLEWKDMKCFHHMITQSPKLFAELVSGAFRKDHKENDEKNHKQSYQHNMYAIYDKLKFCPTENDGEVSIEKLEKWVEQYRKLLIENDQISLFSLTLGRLFSYSPLGVDGYEPCEAVRKMIEKYGDDKMINSYMVAVINRRGVYTPSAGKVEFQMAKKFKENAQILEPHYPKTAKIFNKLYEEYMNESDRERLDAENGWL